MSSHQQPQEEGSTNQRRDHADRQLQRRHHCPRDSIASNQERGAEQRRRRQHDAVIRADQQAHEMRDDDADESDRAADRDRGAGGE